MCLGQWSTNHNNDDEYIWFPVKLVTYNNYLAMMLCINVVNTLWPRQNCRHFADDDVLKCIFFNENIWITLKISLKFAPKVPINTIAALVQIMAWRLVGAKPLSEPTMVSLPTHIFAHKFQWYYSCICSDYCLALGRRQAIIWTNDA